MELHVGEAMIETRSLSKTYGYKQAKIEAVKNINLRINSKEILGLVGESGSGKTTLGKLLLGIESPDLGQIYYQGTDITKNRPRLLYKDIQMIFQDPFSSLNPRMTVKDIISEPLIIHQVYDPSLVPKLLDHVGLPANSINRYPHEFSGGQRQRIGVARALALKPKFIICDEALASLDVSIQAQIANLLLNLQQEYKMAYLYISHDLAMVRYLCHRIAVMYKGQIVETAPAEDLVKTPRHPHTIHLIKSLLVNN
jgi:ABC-type oligopeptide transport system ATPase subunit